LPRSVVSWIVCEAAASWFQYKQRLRVLPISMAAGLPKQGASLMAIREAVALVLTRAFALTRTWRYSRNSQTLITSQ